MLPVDIDTPIHEICPELAEFIARYPFVEEGLEEMKKFDEENPFKHSLRMGHAARRVNDTMEIVPEKMKENFLIAVLLHDIGKTDLSQNVFLGEEEHGIEEKQYRERHAREGFEWIRKYNETASEIAVAHHEFQDEPYPRKSLDRQPTPPPGGWTSEQQKTEHVKTKKEIMHLARILAILDSFDAMTNNRTYQQAKDVQEVGDILRQKFNTEEDYMIIDMLVEETKKMAPSNTEK